MKDAEKQLINDVFNEAKRGTLTNPQQSATIIIETEYLSNGTPAYVRRTGNCSIRKTWKLREVSYWVTERAEANKEYPLGVDMILIDRNSNMMCLPRTTNNYDCEVS